MKKYIVILLIIGLNSCGDKQFKTKYIYWEPKTKSIVKWKMQVTPEGIADGVCFHYYRNGQLLSKARYEDNRLMEIYEVYDSLGNKLNHGNFKNGNGYAISYDDKKGTRNFAGNYKDGLRDGWWKTYNFRGALTDSIFFEHGINEGLDFYLFLLY
jgi:antitoxin component YwqK of YwqJK toxin-antitoxin module